MPSLDHSLYYSVTIKTDIITVLPLVRTKQKKHNISPSKYKCSPYRRNARIIQAGIAHEWKTFITLTFNDEHYFDRDYQKLQKQFRYLMNKKLPRAVKRPIKYIAVLEHGTRTHRAHYHLLTDLSIQSPVFVTRRETPSGPHRPPGKSSRVYKHLAIWSAGFSDVRKLDGSQYSIYYLIKYLGKSGKRTPPGKREVFFSRGLYKPKKIVLDALQIEELLRLTGSEKIYTNHSCDIYKSPCNLQKLCYNNNDGESRKRGEKAGQLSLFTL